MSTSTATSSTETGETLPVRKSKRLEDSHSHENVKAILISLKKGPERTKTAKPWKKGRPKSKRGGRARKKPLVILSHQNDNMALILDLDDRPGPDDLTDYEELRDRNIRQRAEMLNKLGLEKIKHQPKKRILKPKLPVSPRKSQRLRDRTYSDFSLEEVVKFSVSKEDARKVQLFENQMFLDKFRDVLKGPPGDGVSFSGNVNEQLQALRRKHESRRILPGRSSVQRKSGDKRQCGVVSLALHPSTDDTLLVAAGDEYGCVGMWDGQSMGQEFKYHTRTVACMNFNVFKTQELLTTSHDGTVRCFDLENQVVRLLYGRPDDEFAAHHPTLYHAQWDPSTILVAMHQGRVGVLDVRQKCTEKMSRVMQVFEESAPQTVTVHPTKPHLFACPNLKGECKLFDIRAAQEKSLIQEVLGYEPHHSGVRTAMISSVTGSSVATLGDDAKLRVFETETGKAKSVMGLEDEVMHIEWHPSQEDLLFVNMRDGYDRSIRAFSSTGMAYTPVFPGDRSEQRPPWFTWLFGCTIFKCHPSKNIMACGLNNGWATIFALESI